MTTPAGRIQGKIIAHAKSRGLKVKRNYMGPGTETGWPDLTLFGPNARVLFVEVKAPGDTLRGRQTLIINELRSLGHTVIIAEDPAVAIAEIDSFFAPVLDCLF